MTLTDPRRFLSHSYPHTVLYPTQTNPVQPDLLDLHTLSGEQQQIAQQVLMAMERVFSQEPAADWKLNFAVMEFTPSKPSINDENTLEAHPPPRVFSLIPGFNRANPDPIRALRLERAITYIVKRISNGSRGDSFRPDHGHLVWPGWLVRVGDELSWDTMRSSFEDGNPSTEIASLSLWFQRPRQPRITTSNAAGAGDLL